MKRFNKLHKFFATRSPFFVVAILITCVGFISLAATTFAIATRTAVANDGKTRTVRVVTFYDNDAEKTIITNANTVAEAIKDAGITLGPHDSIAPATDIKLSEAVMVINIRRARPVVILDGARQVRVITPAGSNADIAAAAGIKLYPEDVAKLSLVNDFIKDDGAGLEMKITRAKVINLKLYGQQLVVRTRGQTVAELLNEKKIKLGSDDGMNLELTDPITNQMNLQIWRNGVQAVTATEEIAFTTKTIKDNDRFIGYHEVQTKGQAGQKTVIYEIEMRDGEEVGRKVISEIINTPAVEQVELVGAKQRPGNGLTKGKGVNQFQDSSGVIHRETYYDLNMKVVMRNCSQGGYYMVRNDGVKVDRDGYVIIAAHLGRYPRCSVVETSVGAGKVYDTGGFVSRYPDGWDIATDWSNGDGV